MAPHTLSILLVDDRPQENAQKKAQALAAQLPPLGAVLEAVSCRDTARLKAQEAGCALILIDLRDDATAGLALASWLRQTPDTAPPPMLLLLPPASTSTPFPSPTDLDALCQHGTVDALVDPIAPRILASKLAFFVELCESRRAAQALRASTERHALLLESSAEGICGLGVDGLCSYVNRAGARMLGHAPQDLVGRPWREVLQPCSAGGTPCPPSACRISQALRRGTFARVEDEAFRHRDGGMVWVSCSVSPMGGQAGSVITFTDVTERRRVEEALRVSNERTRLATDASGLGLYTWEVATDEVTWHNDRPREIFGLPKNAAPLNASRFAAEFVHPHDLQDFAQSMAITLAQGAPFYFLGRIHRLPDRAVRWVEFTGRLETGAGHASPRVVGTAADVTLRRQSEELLRESEQRLTQLANTIPVLAWMADADGSVTWYNDRWYAYTGTRPGDMAGWGWTRVHDPAMLPAVMERWRVSLASGAPFEMTCPLLGADGVFRPFFTLVAPLHDSQGRIKQWFGTNTDVSPLKQAENELREADRKKDEFLAMLAHELRNPLAPVRNAAEVLRRLNPTDPRIHRASDIIARQVQHMSDLLDDLLDVSRVTRGLVTLDKQRISLGAALASAVEQVKPLMESKRQGLSVDERHGQTQVLASKLRLTQVIANLLDNAAKYSAPGTRIAVEVGVSKDDVCIAVSDSGIGIAPGLLPHVFEPFSQAERGPDRSQGGLGLGLAVVKGLVEMHGGRVRAHSDGLGKGSRFEVVLPVCGDV